MKNTYVITQSSLDSYVVCVHIMILAETLTIDDVITHS